MSVVRRIFIIVVLLLIGAAVVYAFLPKPVEVDVATIDFGPMRVMVDDDGQTRIKEKYIVSTPLAGRVQRIELDPGDAVTANQTVVALIDPTDPALLDVRAHTEAEARAKAAEAALSRADAMLLRAQETLAFEQRERQRLAELSEREAARGRELEQKIFAEKIAGQDLRSAEFARDIAQFELEQARAALLRTSGSGAGATTTPAADSIDSITANGHFAIRSPISGEVLRVMQESMTVVSPGTPLVELGDPRDLEVVVDVLSTDGAKIERGAAVILDGWGGEHNLTGVVRLVEPSAFTKISALGVEEQRVNAIVDLLTPAEQRTTLGDGFRVEAHIVLWEQPKVLKAPMSALFREGEAWVTYVVDGGRATKRTLRVGRQNGMEAEILDGLRPGDTVIIHPSDAVQERSRVTARR
jgi:HlyD family secretion protein